MDIRFNKISLHYLKDFDNILHLNIAPTSFFKAEIDFSCENSDVCHYLNRVSSKSVIILSFEDPTPINCGLLIFGIKYHGIKVFM